MTSSIKQALLSTSAVLQKKEIASASLDAELLLSFTIKKPREYILAHPEITLTKAQISKFNNLIKQRAKHVPLAYLVKEKEFYGRPFYVDERVLVPRPETENIISEFRIKNLPACNTLHSNAGRELKNNVLIIDIGTGSGCIIITLAKELQNYKNLKFLATDISQDALNVARKNTRLHGVNKKIKFLRGNLLEPILKILNVKYLILNNIDEIIIIANLPYLDDDLKNLLKSSDSKALKYEPQIALKGGKDGLKYYRELATQIREFNIQYPNIPISLLAEIGNTQGKKMKQIFSFAKNKTVKKDLAGRDRIFIAKL